MDAAPSNWHCSRFKEQESILGFRRIRSENSSGSSSFSSRSLRAKRRRKPACTASFPSYDGASVHILAISSFTETDHRLSYSSRTGRAQGSLGYSRSSPLVRTVGCHSLVEMSVFPETGSLFNAAGRFNGKCMLLNTTRGLSDGSG